MLSNSNKIVRFSDSGPETHESGVIYVLLAILLPALFAFMALALDIGIYLTMKTNLQSAADTAVTSAVTQFARMDTARLTPWGMTPAGRRNYRDLNFRYLPIEDPNPGSPLDPTDILQMRRDRLALDFENSQRAFFAGISAHIQGGNLRGLNDAARQALSQGFGAPFNAGNANLTFERGIRCYLNNVRMFCPIEGDPDNWTYANAARMTISVQTEGRWFAAILPGAINPVINISSWAYIPFQIGGQCGAPDCNELGENGNFLGGCREIRPDMQWTGD